MEIQSKNIGGFAMPAATAKAVAEMQTIIDEMKAQEKAETAARRLGYMALDLAFILVVAGLTQVGKLPAIPAGWVPVLFVLATLRTARTISYNNIMQWVRAPFTTVQPDSCGAGDNVHPAGRGARYVIGDLIACPICTGTWAALALVAAWTLYEPAGRVLVYALGFAGGSELLHWVGEYFEWQGRAGRVVSGQISPDGGK